MSRSLDFLYDDCAGRKLFGRNRQLAGPPQYAIPLCRSVLVLSPIGSISLSYNAIKCNIIDKMLELFQTLQTRLNENKSLNLRAIEARIKGELSADDLEKFKEANDKSIADIEEQLNSLKAEQFTIEQLMADARR